MIPLTFLNSYSPILVLLVSFILIYAALTKLKIPGSEVTLAILSALLSLIFISSDSAVKYVFSLIPFLTVIMTIAIFVMIMLVFVAKDIETFKKPLARIGFTLAILLVLGFAFNQFPTLHNMLPKSPSTGLDPNLNALKGWIYSPDIIDSVLLIGSVLLVGFFLTKKAAK
jgi:hypothetical protein